jgi:precorrin-6B methylase 2
MLPQLLDEQQKFDVIYVDGSHVADDVLTDGITAWRLLKQGEVLILTTFCGIATCVRAPTLGGRSICF